MTAVPVDAACKVPRLATYVLDVRRRLRDDPALDALHVHQIELLVGRCWLRALPKDIDARRLEKSLR